MTPNDPENGLAALLGSVNGAFNGTWISPRNPDGGEGKGNAQLTAGS